MPSDSIEKIQRLLADHPLVIDVVKHRKTKHGDYRKLPSGKVLITLNEQPNPYRFLITLLHEIAHHLAFQSFGFNIKPHGKEWQHCFRQVAAPFLVENIFPKELLAVFAQHLKRPKASSDTDSRLGNCLQKYDPKTSKKTVADLPQQSLFQLDNGRVFRKGALQRKRFLCSELSSNKPYLFQPHAMVEHLK